MLRVALWHLFLFLLPFIGWFIYVWLVRTHAITQNGPWIRLVVAGLALVMISLVVIRINSGEPVDAQYIPPHMEDGELVPGQYVPSGNEL